MLCSSITSVSIFESTRRHDPEEHRHLALTFPKINVLANPRGSEIAYEKHHNLQLLFYRMLLSQKLKRSEGHRVLMEEVRNACEILVGMHEGKILIRMYGWILLVQVLI